MDSPPVPPDFGAEFAALKAKLAAVEEERDSLRSTSCKRQATTPIRPDHCRRVSTMPRLIPQNWSYGCSAVAAPGSDQPSGMRQSVGVDVHAIAVLQSA